MHNIKAIVENPKYYTKVWKDRGVKVDVNALIERDMNIRFSKTEIQTAQMAINGLSKQIGALKGGGNSEELKQQVADQKAVISKHSAMLIGLEESLRSILLSLPNDLLAIMPIGKTESDNEIEHTFAVPQNEQAIPHFEIPIGFDFEAGAKLSGSRFTVLRNGAARLHRALGQFMIDHATYYGFEEIIPPVIVNTEAMEGTGQLPKFADDAYQVGDQWLIPTAEVSLTNLAAGRIHSMDELPLKFVALTPCFRQEAGSAGRDTRGILRQHQFEKVELVAITTPENASAQHHQMILTAQAVLEKLGLGYRRLLLCSGDTGFSSALTYDLEVWMAGSREYREISSISNCLSFQARRMGARYRNADGKVEFVHTLNGSSLAVGRTLAAFLEQYYRGDHIEIPEVLREYMGGKPRIEL